MDSVNILGTPYKFDFKKPNDDKSLKDCDGYCDKTTKEIVVIKCDNGNCNLHNPEWYERKVLRHEIVHAFLFESGLHENVNWNDELLVDWIATQGLKIYKAWQEANCLG